VAPSWKRENRMEQSEKISLIKTSGPEKVAGKESLGAGRYQAPGNVAESREGDLSFLLGCD